jgi:hypothetical protein
MTFYANGAGAVEGETGTAGELLPSVSIEALLQRREALHGIIDQIGALLAQADALAAAGGFGSVSRYADSDRYGRSGRANMGTDKGRGYILKELDANGWKYLLDESGLRSFMCASKRKEWDEAIYNGEVPPLDRATIAGTFAQLYESRGDMLEQGVIELYRKLSWHYKSNSPVAFGKKIIRAYALSMGSPNSSFADELDDLSRVMHKLEGRPEEDHRRDTWHLLCDAYRAKTDYEDEYVRVRMYRTTQTAHVIFKRPELVQRMNAILAKHYPNALPAPR